MKCLQNIFHRNVATIEMDGFFVLKRNGVLYWENKLCYQSRNEYCWKMIREADKRLCFSDFGPVYIQTDDCEEYWKIPRNIPYFRFSTKTKQYDRTIPDFVFSGWPEAGMPCYWSTVQEVIAVSSQPALKNCVGWIGNLDTHSTRKVLKELSQQHPDLLEVQHIQYDQEGKNPQPFLSFSELVARYAMLIDIQGFGYSGRLKLLLWSRRPLLLVHRIHEEYFYAFLKPWIHFIPVNENLDNLVEQIHWIKAHPEQAQAIADNAKSFAEEYLTPEAVHKVWANRLENSQTIDLKTIDVGCNIQFTGGVPHSE